MSAVDYINSSEGLVLSSDAVGVNPSVVSVDSTTLVLPAGPTSAFDLVTGDVVYVVDQSAAGQAQTITINDPTSDEFIQARIIVNNPTNATTFDFGGGAFTAVCAVSEYSVIHVVWDPNASAWINLSLGQFS